MEERVIKVTLEKAKKWFNSSNCTLKELALQAFSKEELELLSVEDIIKQLLENKEFYNLNDTQIIQLRSIYKRTDMSKVSAPKLLRILAKFYNKKWKKTLGNTGFFFTENAYHGTIYNNIEEDWSIVAHESVCYPGIVYFNSSKDCKEAFKIIKSLGKLNSLYTDF